MAIIYGLFNFVINIHSIFNLIDLIILLVFQDVQQHVANVLVVITQGHYN